MYTEMQNQDNINK